ncbi:hypothetical protein C8034_v000273 [Colletotrichum sidae]|uniref:Uncharacterized protein n=1 Tax=Colletotrichum sidae TaxID=1347389 RepID=A0A4R8THY9_9PEZI|nr:hypothetical protein C8034_v000273 [Colletotrichum sidae]
MKLAVVLAVFSLATSVTAKHYCFGGCVKCYCGDVKYDSHRCQFCSCNHNAYASTNETNPQGTCDLEDGFHLGCGWRIFGKCLKDDGFPMKKLFGFDAMEFMK